MENNNKAILAEVYNDDALIERENIRHQIRNQDDRPFDAVQTGGGACQIIRF